MLTIVLYLRKEIFKERVVNPASFGVILDLNHKRMRGQPHLLHDIVGPAPCFDVKSIGQPVDGLMM